MEKLLAELKQKIVDTLDLQNVTPEGINENEQLVGGDLGIDSIDVLELVMMIEKEYAVKLDVRDVGIEVFATLRTLAEYIHGKCREFPH